MLRYSKVRDVADIQRGTSNSAGIDFFVPNDWNNGVPYAVAPGERVLIPSGIHLDMIGSGLADHALIFFNKSGVGSKKGLDVLACVVDSDYQGEVHINLVNTDSANSAIITPGEKIIQGVLLPVAFYAPEQVSFEELYASETDRGAGGFGSTNE